MNYWSYRNGPFTQYFSKFYDPFIIVLNYSMIMNNFWIVLIIFIKLYFSPRPISITSCCLIELSFPLSWWTKPLVCHYDLRKKGRHYSCFPWGRNFNNICKVTTLAENAKGHISHLFSFRTWCMVELNSYE